MTAHLTGLRVTLRVALKGTQCSCGFSRVHGILPPRGGAASSPGLQFHGYPRLSTTIHGYPRQTFNRTENEMRSRQPFAPFSHSISLRPHLAANGLTTNNDHRLEPDHLRLRTPQTRPLLRRVLRHRCGIGRMLLSTHSELAWLDSVRSPKFQRGHFY